MAEQRKPRARAKHPSQSQSFADRPGHLSHVIFDQALPQLTMSQEARNTERHTLWRSNLQLRHNGIQFISAGEMLSNHSKILNDLSDLSLHDSNYDLNTLKTTTHVAKEYVEKCKYPPCFSSKIKNLQQYATDGPDNLPTTINQLKNVFPGDTCGEKRTRNLGLESPSVKSDSTLRTDSSDDEVVFAGRGRMGRDPISVVSCTRRSTFLPTHQVKETSHQGDSSTLANSPVCVNEQTWGSSTDYTLEPALLIRKSPHDLDVFLGVKGNPRNRSHNEEEKQLSENFADDQAVLPDYVADMKEEDTSETHWSEADTNATPVPTRHGQGIPLPRIPDVTGHLDSMRKRDKDIRYLVAGKGQGPDEARYIRKEHMASLGEEELVRNSEQDTNLMSPWLVCNENSDSALSDEAMNIASDDVNFEEIQSHSAEQGHKRMSDGQIAGALEMQELLVLPTDDVSLLDRSEDFDDAEYIEPTLKATSTSSSRRRRSRHQKRQVPGAGRFADTLLEGPCGGFDVMDFDHPSPLRITNGRREVLGLGLSDSELKWDLQMSREHDRTKKRMRRQQREELRIQGLLGSKPGKVNMRAKYSEGMSVGDVKEEIRAFLLSSSECLSFPPMNKNDRKVVHHLANLVSLRSLSRGSGLSRFPVLTKTSLTPHFNEQSIGEADKLLSEGRFMRRMDKCSRRRGGSFETVKSSRAGVKAATYMDGDVVGASAPEIGAENRGRAMLERMGWSTGTALGASNNKGILQPVTHVVKNSKAGLG